MVSEFSFGTILAALHVKSLLITQAHSVCVYLCMYLCMYA